MKIKQLFLSGLLALYMTTSVAANLTNLNWGGYVSTTDSPVIGGAVWATNICAQNGPITGCLEYYLDMRGFGLTAYTGTATYAAAVGNGTNRYRGIAPACPANTAMINMPTGYKRADTLAMWDGVFNGITWTYLSGAAESFVCVKTDTY